MDNSMKITVGLGSIDEYERFVQAGADEFFCGYVPFSWAEKYGTVMPLNRREVLCYNVQLGAYSELEILSRMVKKYKKPVHLTFNSLYYLPEQYPEIGDIIEKCMEIGFRSYIIADPALLVYLKNRGLSCEIHLSGETGEVNSEMLKMFRRFPLKRLIFHRKNTFRDMQSVIASQREVEKQAGTRPEEGMEFEAFVLNEMCNLFTFRTSFLGCSILYSLPQIIKCQNNDHDQYTRIKHQSWISLDITFTVTKHDPPFRCRCLHTKADKGKTGN